MGVDGIGKPGGSGPVAGIATSAVQGASSPQTFSIDPTPSDSNVTGSQALGQLQRGELTVDQYLEIQVESATRHIGDKVAPEQLQLIRESLREQLESDPVLMELVRRTVGTEVGG